MTVIDLHMCLPLGLTMPHVHAGDLCIQRESQIPGTGITGVVRGPTSAVNQRGVLCTSNKLS